LELKANVINPQFNIGSGNQSLQQIITNLAPSSGQSNIQPIESNVLLLQSNIQPIESNVLLLQNNVQSLQTNLTSGLALKADQTNITYELALKADVMNPQFNIGSGNQSLQQIITNLAPSSGQTNVQTLQTSFDQILAILTNSSFGSLISPPTIVQVIPFGVGTFWASVGHTYNYYATSGTRLTYRINAPYNSAQFEIEYDYFYKMWYDKGPEAPQTIFQSGGYVLLRTPGYDGTNGTQILGTFTDPYYFTRPTIVQTIQFGAGTHWGDDGSSYNYYTTYGTKYVYRLNAPNNIADYEIQYDYVSKTWSDKGSSFPHTVSQTIDFIQITSPGYDGTSGSKILGTFSDPYHVLTKASNLALRTTFENNTVYLNSNTAVSGTMTVSNNSFLTTTSYEIQGFRSGYKSNTSTKFRISNFISNPYTITFWVFSPFTGTWGGQFKTILSPDRYFAVNTWRMYFSDIGGLIGFHKDLNGSQGFVSTGINYTNIYNRWVMMSISSSGRVSIKGTNTTDYDGLLISGAYDTAGDSFEFSAADDTTLYDTLNMYFDDIRVYNAELTSTELTTVYNELRFRYDYIGVYIEPGSNVAPVIVNEMSLGLNTISNGQNSINFSSNVAPFYTEAGSNVALKTNFSSLTNGISNVNQLSFDNSNGSGIYFYFPNTANSYIGFSGHTIYTNGVNLKLYGTNTNPAILSTYSERFIVTPREGQQWTYICNFDNIVNVVDLVDRIASDHRLYVHSPTDVNWSMVSGSNSRVLATTVTGNDGFFLAAIGTNKPSASALTRADNTTGNMWNVTATTYLEFYNFPAGRSISSIDGMFYPVNQAEYNYIITLGNNAPTDVELVMRADGKAALQTGSTPTTLATSSSNVFTAGRWHYVALTWSNVSLELKGYVNGVLAVSTLRTPPATIRDMLVGREGGRGNFNQHYAYEYNMYYRVLTAAEVFRQYRYFFKR
jgi:hypothetical protein